MTGGRRWLTGCAVGCGVLLVAALGACVVGALFLKHTFRGIEKASTSYRELVGELGDVGEYVPSDGTPSAGRLEAFLQVREATAGARGEVEAALARLPPSAVSDSGKVVSRVRVGLSALGDLIDGIGSYLQARNRAMLERDMGIGEYVYLYTLAYYSWLGHSPTAAPTPRGEPDGVRLGVFDDGDALFGEGAVRRRYRRYVLGMTRAQVAALPPPAEAGGEGWRARLEGEIRRLEVDPGYVLWQDGLPGETEAALEPFRERLEATWSATTNRVEMPLAGHETPWEWR